MSKIKEELNLAIEEVEKYIKKYSDYNLKYREVLKEAMDYSLFTGGKRLRPVFGLKTFLMFDDNFERYMKYAVAVECIHTYSLIHDDLPSMDNDDYRRGKKTNHKVFGEDIAILAGDALLNTAFELMVMDDENLENELIQYKRKIEAIKEISYYSGINGMIGGQVIDITSNKENITKEKLFNMYKMKTAGLFQAAIISGAIIGGASNEEIEILKDYSLYLGLSYQIQDDILDLEEDKSIDKLTYVSFLGIEEAKKIMDNYVSRALEALDKLENRDTIFLEKLTKLLVNREI